MNELITHRGMAIVFLFLALALTLTLCAALLLVTSRRLRHRDASLPDWFTVTRPLYRERAELLTHLTRVYAAHGPVLAYNDPHWPRLAVLYLTVSGAGQMSWHIHPDDLHLFAAVPIVDADDPRARFDGHDTIEKYARLRRLPCSPADQGATK